MHAAKVIKMVGDGEGEGGVGEGEEGEEGCGEFHFQSRVLGVVWGDEW